MYFEFGHLLPCNGFRIDGVPLLDGVCVDDGLEGLVGKRHLACFGLYPPHAIKHTTPSSEMHPELWHFFLIIFHDAAKRN